METLVALAHHRNNGSRRSHGSTPSGSFRGTNCRTFYSGEGLPSPPFKSSSTKTPLTKKSLCSSTSPKTNSPSLIEDPNMSRTIAKTSSVPIPMNIEFENDEGGLNFSELWAGPAYSNSPPPSSLPMPKFSMSPKRTVSLNLPTLASEIDFSPLSKSAPASPRERSPSPSDMFDIADSATKTLRRMLNLDIGDH